MLEMCTRISGVCVRVGMRACVRVCEREGEILPLCVHMHYGLHLYVHIYEDGHACVCAC